MQIKRITIAILFILLLCSFIVVDSRMINNSIHRKFVLDNLNLSKPNLTCSPDSISWNWIKPGSILSYNFTVENINKSGLEISWRIIPPDWGLWDFQPEFKNNQKPEDGEIQVDFNVIVPEENNTDFKGDISIVNIDNPDDYYTISISISTVKSRLNLKSLFILIINKFIFLNNIDIIRGR